MPSSDCVCHEQGIVQNSRMAECGISLYPGHASARCHYEEDIKLWQCAYDALSAVALELVSGRL